METDQIVCEFCHRPKHIARDCWVNPYSKNFTVEKLRPLAQVNQPPITPMDVVCGWCTRANHSQQQCVFNPTSADFDINELQLLARTRLPKGKVFCSLCHRPAHTVSECYFNPKSPNYDPALKNPRLCSRKSKSGSSAKKRQ